MQQIADYTPSVFSLNLELNAEDGQGIYSGHSDSESVGTAHNQEMAHVHKEAYFLFFVAVVGLVLNLIVVIFIFVRQPLRKMTSAFLVHACFLDFLKSSYCIPIGRNLLTQQEPSECDFLGASYVVIVTAYSFNMMAMVCTEAYTFGETNIGGNTRGSLCCVIFGIVLVYVASTILHLGPTLIGGYFEFQKEIGNCMFVLGKQTGYVANVMWIVIITLAMIGMIHFICKLYKEIQANQPNRVSMLVRSSITIMDEPTMSACNVRAMVKDSTQRARIFVINTVCFILCWYPMFLLLLFDVDFDGSPQAYQALCFIAWSHGAIQPVIYIFFDRNLNILSRYTYCDEYRLDIETIAQLLNRQRNHTNRGSGPSASEPDDRAQYCSCAQVVPADVNRDIPLQTTHQAENSSNSDRELSDIQF